MKVLIIIPALYRFPDTVYTCILRNADKFKLDYDIIIATGNSLIKGEWEKVKVVYCPPDFSKTKAFRVSTAINRGLEGVDLSKYEWLIKIDDDVLFNDDFIVDNINADYDLMGKGAVMFIRMSLFGDIMGGKFFMCNTDDTYIATVFEKHRTKTMLWRYENTPTRFNKVVNSKEEVFLAGFDAGRMGAHYPYKFYKKPLTQLVGYIIGRYFYPFKLPIFSSDF